MPKPYTAPISRVNPMCFLFLIDQSRSMADPFGADSTKRKSDGVADAINHLLQTMVLRCAQGDTILDRFYLGVIGYGKQVGSGLGGELAGQGLLPVSQIANHPLRVETRQKKVYDGAGGMIEQTAKFPVWFEPVAEGRTPMCEALQEARGVIQSFVDRYPGCFPPIVINITDGEAMDGDPEPVAAALCEVSSQDGNALLFNIHVSDKKLQPVQFAGNEKDLPDEHARKLFRMSSRLPEIMISRADRLMPEGARGFVFNGDLVSVIDMLDIGTRVGLNR